MSADRSIDRGAVPRPEQDVTNRLLTTAALLPDGTTVRLKARAFELVQERVLRSMADLTVSDVARIYHVSPSTVRAWIRSGLLEAYRVGKRYFVTRSAMEAFSDYAICQAVLEKLERDGVLVKNGKYRPGEGGILEPVYVLVEYAEQPGTGGGSDDLCDNRS